MTRVLETIFGLLVLLALPTRGWYRSRRRQFFNVPAYVTETIFLTLYLLLLLSLNHVTLQTIGLHFSPWSQFFAHCVLGVSVVIGLDLGALFVIRASRNSGVTLEREQAFPVNPLLVVVVCILSAFWEELCFRGVPLYLAGPRFFAVLAALLSSSLVFALQHLREGIDRATYAGFYGALFFVLYLVTHDLGATMIAHASGNLFASLYGSREYWRRQRLAHSAFDVSQLP